MTLTTAQQDALLNTLKARFEKHMNRHVGIDWAQVQAKLDAHPAKWVSLHEMESSGGEPDVVGYDSAADAYLFYDCCTESPKGRRSLCYDREALESRKDYPPQNTVLDMAASMGIALMTEAEYRVLQNLGHFDTKTSSWLKTPDDIRKFGGAIYGDYRYRHVFIYHNGASSYYAARGFRGVLRV